MLLLYSTVDEFVMNNLMNYSGKSLVSAESAKLDLDSKNDETLSDDEAKNLAEWWAKEVLRLDGTRQPPHTRLLYDAESPPAAPHGHPHPSSGT